MPNDLDNLPAIHPRELPCMGASNELAAYLLDWHKRHELTSAEYADILASRFRDFTRTLVAIERRRES